jgi:hypothetical protein
MLRFLAYLLVFVIGGAVGFLFGGFGGSAVGTLVGICKTVNAANTAQYLSQEQVNATVKSVFDEIVAETKVSPDDLKKQIPAVIQEMSKRHPGTTTACQTALSAL